MNCRKATILVKMHRMVKTRVDTTLCVPKREAACQLTGRFFCASNLLIQESAPHISHPIEHPTFSDKA